MNGGPEQERHMAQATLRTAVSMAKSGRIVEGYQRLQDGLDRMEMLESLQLEWAQTLAKFYREALGLYAKAYRVKAAARQPEMRRAA